MNGSRPWGLRGWRPWPAAAAAALGSPCTAAYTHVATLCQCLYTITNDMTSFRSTMKKNQKHLAGVQTAPPSATHTRRRPPPRLPLPHCPLRRHRTHPLHRSRSTSTCASICDGLVAESDRVHQHAGQVVVLHAIGKGLASHVVTGDPLVSGSGFASRSPPTFQEPGHRERRLKARSL